MGKGDIKSKKGKIKAGSSGVSRQKKKEVIEIKPKAAKKAAPKKAAAVKKPAAKKAPAKKKED
jgi:ribosomal small subunit protein bTHX